MTPSVGDPYAARIGESNDGSRLVAGCHRSLEPPDPFPALGIMQLPMEVGGGSVCGHAVSDEQRRPKGLLLWLFRLGPKLYRWRLGWLLGRRFLLLEHTGRKSGLTRETALEAMRYDASGRVYIVAAAFGPSSDWYRNVLAEPDVTIRVSGGSHPAVAEPLAPTAAYNEFVSYGTQHRLFIRLLPKMTGRPFDGSEAAYRRVAEEMPLVALSIR